MTRTHGMFIRLANPLEYLFFPTIWNVVPLEYLYSNDHITLTKAIQSYNQVPRWLMETKNKIESNCLQKLFSW